MADASVLADGASAGLVQGVIDHVRAHIRSRKLQPGDTIPSETAFAAEMGVSRTVTREAFRGLAALKVIDVGGGRRARVTAPDESALSIILDHTVQIRQLSIQQVLDVRRTIEMRTVALAAVRRNDEQVGELFGHVETMQSSFDDPQQMMLNDIAFHEVIARSSGNPLYSTIVNSFRVITLQTWNMSWRSRTTMENRKANIDLHGRIAQAIIDQDPERAEREMAEHFDSAASALTRAGIV